METQVDAVPRDRLATVDRLLKILVVHRDQDGHEVPGHATYRPGLRARTIAALACVCT
jgi:hypothetical protein